MNCKALERLISEDRHQAPAESVAVAALRSDETHPAEAVAEALDALKNLDRHRLNRILSDASVEMSGPAFRQRLIVPLLAMIGERWQEGSLRIVHEHLASIIVRSFLSASRNHTERSRAPRMIITTPSGQYHELGALMASAIAEEMGWDVFYLGASLPAEEIAAAVKLTGAKAVALSLCFRESDSHTIDELTRLRRLLDPEIPIYAGGHAIHPLRERLAETGVICPADLAEFRDALQTVVGS
jgi:methanogenic corrinoid protein MtbC1